MIFQYNLSNKDLQLVSDNLLYCNYFKIKLIMINTIIFDYGGVLTHENAWENTTSEYLEKLGLDSDQENKILKKYWQKAKVGGIPSDNFWEEISKVTKVDKDTIRQEVFESFSADQRMLALIKKIKMGSYKLGLLSNMIDDWADHIETTLELDKIFDVIMFSSREKDMKPNESIFKLALKNLDSEASKTLFIDDKEKNTLAASKIGLNVILHKNFEDTVSQMKEMGILS